MFFPKKYKKIFITGGAGFIGSHLSEKLASDDRDIIIFDNLSSGKKSFIEKILQRKNVKFIKGDLLKPNDLRRALPNDVDIVIHLASNPDISKGFKEPYLDFNQTVIATFNLLQEMKEKSVRNLIYFSGSGVYGDTGKNFAVESQGQLLPVSMYGASKLSAESLISAFSHLYIIKTWIFRPANIVGSNATHGVIFDFINKLRSNPKQLEMLGDGKQSKSYVYVSDVLDAVSHAIKSGKQDINIYNISSNNFITVNQIAEIVIEAMALKHVKIKHTPGKVGWPGDVPVIRIDNTKLKKTGWNARYTSRKAVTKTVQDLLK